MRQQADEVPMRQTAATSSKQEDNQRDLLEDHRAGDREASSRHFQRVAKNQEMDLAERQTPSKMKKEIVHGVRPGYVGAPATPGIIASTVGREGERERERK
jgi:hypothetical protein